MFFVILTLVSQAGFTQAAPSVQGNPDDDHQKNLWLTHSLVSMVVTTYTNEAKNEVSFIEKTLGKTKIYRPDSLLQSEYFLTFLDAWLQDLKAGNITNTLNYWLQVYKRDSYLGQFHSYWQKLFPSMYKVDESINLGHYRESFLTDVLYSENHLNFEARSLQLLSDAASMFLASRTDEPLGIAIINAMRVHPSEKVRRRAEEILQAWPRNKIVIDALTDARNFVLGSGATRALPFLTRGIVGASVAGAINDTRFAVQTSERLLQWLAPRLPEIKISGMTKIVTASALAHVVAILAIHPTEKKTVPAKTAAAEGEMTDFNFTEFMMGLQMQVGEMQVRPRVDLREDFKPARFQFMNLQEWQSWGEAFLQGRENNFNYFQFFLNREFLQGFFPSDKNLAAATFMHEFHLLRKSAKQLPAGDFESLRKLLMDGPLKFYASGYPALSSVFLDWGGNCIARNHLFISLLLENPQLIPAGYQVGGASYMDHEEPVLYSSQSTKYLVAGSETYGNPEVSIIAPYGYVYAALKALANNSLPAPAGLYMNGTPTKNPSIPGYEYSEKEHSVRSSFAVNDVRAAAPDFKNPEFAQSEYNPLKIEFSKYLMTGSGEGAADEKIQQQTVLHKKVMIGLTPTEFEIFHFAGNTSIADEFTGPTAMVDADGVYFQIGTSKQADAHTIVRIDAYDQVVGPPELMRARLAWLMARPLETWNYIILNLKAKTFLEQHRLTALKNFLQLDSFEKPVAQTSAPNPVDLCFDWQVLQTQFKSKLFEGAANFSDAQSKLLAEASHALPPSLNTEFLNHNPLIGEISYLQRTCEPILNAFKAKPEVAISRFVNWPEEIRERYFARRTELLLGGATGEAYVDQGVQSYLNQLTRSKMQLMDPAPSSDTIENFKALPTCTDCSGFKVMAAKKHEHQVVDGNLMQVGKEQLAELMLLTESGFQFYDQSIEKILQDKISKLKAKQRVAWVARKYTWNCADEALNIVPHNYGYSFSDSLTCAHARETKMKMDSGFYEDMDKVFMKTNLTAIADEQRADEQRADEQRADEQRADEQRAEKQREEEQKKLRGQAFYCPGTHMLVTDKDQCPYYVCAKSNLQVKNPNDCH